MYPPENRRQSQVSPHGQSSTDTGDTAAASGQHLQITEMQARAIIEAAMERQGAGHSGTRRDHGSARAGNYKELRYQKGIIDATAEQVFSGSVTDKIDHMVGTMIEVPAAPP